MKSESGSAKAPKWRLGVTTKRKAGFRPIEDDDVRYVWAAYKKGALAPLGLPEDLSADRFREQFQLAVLQNFPATWVLSATTKNGFVPVGVVFAAAAPNAPFFMVTGMCWFPWSSARNKLEAAVNFLNAIRRDLQLVFYALPEHRRLYDVCMMHGILRRVGTSLTAIPGHPAIMYETREKT